MTPRDTIDLDALDHRYQQRRGAGSTSDDKMRAWLPMVIQIVSMLIALGVVYGKLDGRFTLIEYRLGQVEQTMKKP